MGATRRGQLLCFISHPSTGSIFGIIVALCQIEVVVVAIVTGLIVHFVTIACVKQNPILSQDINGNSAELGPARADNRAVYETVGMVVPLVMNLSKCTHHQLTKQYQSQIICSSVGRANHSQ